MSWLITMELRVANKALLQQEEARPLFLTQVRFLLRNIHFSLSLMLLEKIDEIPGPKSLRNDVDQLRTKC
jgi:hypothetical protein